MVRGDKKKNSGGNQKPTLEIHSNDYDLKKNFSKNNSYRGTLRTEQTCSNECDFCQQANPVFNSSIYQQSQGETSANQFGTTYLYERMDKLSDKIDDSNNDLRKELEEKIEKKLPMQWYVWTVFAIVTMVSLIFLLSYKPLIDKVDKISETLSEYISSNSNRAIDSGGNDTLSDKVNKRNE